MTLLCCRRLWFWATFWSLAWPGLVVLRLLLGASEALFFVAGFAMLADIAPTGRADEALSHSALALSPASPSGRHWLSCSCAKAVTHQCGR